MYNKCQLLGRLGKDPQITKFDNGGRIAEFPVATIEQYKDKDGNWKEITDWHNIKITNKAQAEIAEKFLRKGMLVFFDGKMRTRTYQKEGHTFHIMEIIVDVFRMTDKKEGAGGSDQQNTQSNSSSNKSNGNEPTSQKTAEPVDDLPF